MRIETMKDLKRIMDLIPEEVLDKFVIGNTEEGNGLACIDGVELSEMTANYQKHLKNYPELSKLERYFEVLLEGTQDDDLETVSVEIED